MPWTSSDAAQHTKKARSEKQKKAWASAANAARDKAIQEGKSDAEADAIGVQAGNAILESSTVSESLQEYANSSDAALTIDRHACIIRGVKILGVHSQNGRDYTQEAIASAAPLYEKAPVFVDHGRRGESRSYRDRNGYLFNIRVEQEGLYGDHKYNPKHEITEQYLWDAEHAPANVGFSHDIEGVVSRKNGKVVVESIQRVNSVDLVARPATTRGLFEDAGEVPEDQRELCEHGLSAMDHARAILLSEDSTDKKKTRLLEVLSVWQSELAGVNHKENEVEYSELTLDSLKEHRMDLVEKLTGTDAMSKLQSEKDALQKIIEAKDATIKEATDRLTAIEAAQKDAEKKVAIAEELKAAKMDASDKTIVSEAFMEMLNAAPDADARKRLIEDRAAICRRNVATPPTGSPGFGIVEFVATGDGFGPGATAKETLGRL